MPAAAAALSLQAGFPAPVHRPAINWPPRCRYRLTAPGPSAPGAKAQCPRGLERGSGLPALATSRWPRAHRRLGFQLQGREAARCPLAFGFVSW